MEPKTQENQDPGGTADKYCRYCMLRFGPVRPKGQPRTLCSASAQRGTPDTQLRFVLHQWIDEQCCKIDNGTHDEWKLKYSLGEGCNVLQKAISVHEVADEKKASNGNKCDE